MPLLQTLEKTALQARFAGGSLRSRANVTADSLTTFGLGGPVELLFEVGSVGELQQLITELKREGLDWRILGAGSNVVFSDAGISEPVIRLAKGMSGFLVNPACTLAEWVSDPQSTALSSSSGSFRLFALAASSLMSLSRELSQQGFTGLEFAAGIPASIGGALVMNAGAHGHSLSEIVRSVLIINGEGEIYTRSKEDLTFSYRHAKIESGEIVLAVELELASGDPIKIREKRNSCLEYRRRTQPLSMPSSGSVFKNPSLEDWAEGKMPSAPLLSAGAILESIGLKGKRSGSIGYSELHANWLVRYEENGKTSEAVQLIEEGISQATERYGIRLRPEIIVWE